MKEDGTLELSLARTPTPEPGTDDVVVRVEAAPINPSDLGLLLGFADVDSATATGTGAARVLTARIPPRAMPAMASRVGRPLPTGNEGAGVVVAAGSSPASQALLGRTVAIAGGGTYAQYRTLPAARCLPLPPGTTPAQGASSFVNPLTALGFVETMRREGHTALVHTAAASNLGQMLQRLCLEEGIDLVNIVRRREQAELLEALGARHVCNSAEATFADDLTAALAETGATIAFDAIGGGPLAGQILAGMEAAAVRRGARVGRYGTGVHKQVYVYGGLDRGPTVLDRRFGFNWSLGGWLLMPVLEEIGPAASLRLRERVGREITTTFASHYARVLSLAEVLSPDAIRAISRMATGEKVLVAPHAGLAEPGS